MNLGKESVQFSNLEPDQVKRKLEHYKNSGGDTALLGHFIMVSAFWYQRYNKIKLYIPLSLMVGTLVGYYIGTI